jgi:predicted naringenin-chalcone synthase
MTRFLGFGTALPPFQLTADASRRALASIWPHLKSAPIEPVIRYTVRPIAETFHSRSLGEQMRQYAREAPRLALEASAKALLEAGVIASEVDAVISVSCTGYMVPALDVQLGAELGLRPNVVRLPFTELGCSGGGAAIGVAHRFLRAEPESVVLVVCVELCSLTFRSDDSSIDNLAASMVFGDGAAATVMADRPGGLQVERVGTQLLPASQDQLGFQLRDDGFHPILDKRLPRVIAERLPAVLEAFGADPGDFQAVHAGGPRIFDAVEQALGLAPGGLDVSREVFRTYGNLSSASILFVLAALPNVPGRGLAITFGPGVTIELASLRRYAE